MDVIACIDEHAIACNDAVMTNNLLADVENFMAETGLSEHRVGILLARNGRLIERLRDPKRRIWPETAAAIRAALREQRALRKQKGAA